MTTFDSSNLKFEILCIDQEGKVNFSSEKRFIDALSYNEQLWDEIEILETSFGFIDKKKGIKVLIQKLDTSKVVSDLFASAFILTIEAKYDNLETLRRNLLVHLRDLHFNHLRILNDDVSAYIGTQIYPLINKLENLLRRYTVKFFITKIGLKWWEIKVSKDVRDKADGRKKNEPVLTKTAIINADVSLLMYSSDAHSIPELYYLGAKWGRQLLGEVLEQAIADSDITVTEAEAIAVAILRENALVLYKSTP